MKWEKVARLDDMPRDGGVRFEDDDTRIALFRVGEHVYAIGDRCSHAEASLSEGEVFDGEVECPRHGAAFDLATGNAKTLPASSPVPTYAVKIEDGDVYVEVDSR